MDCIPSVILTHALSQHLPLSTLASFFVDDGDRHRGKNSSSGGGGNNKRSNNKRVMISLFFDPVFVYQEITLSSTTAPIERNTDGHNTNKHNNVNNNINSNINDHSSSNINVLETMIVEEESRMSLVIHTCERAVRRLVREVREVERHVNKSNNWTEDITVVWVCNDWTQQHLDPQVGWVVMKILMCIFS